jgi:hypothetical protein
MVVKNVLGINTLTETQEQLVTLPEMKISINRTTLSRNLSYLGDLELCNTLLLDFSKQIIEDFKIKPTQIMSIIDASTIEVYKTSNHEGATWVWDNAESKTIFGYKLEMIVLSINNLYIPVYFALDSLDKSTIINKLIEIRKLTKSSEVSFDGGYPSDEFLKELTKNKFIFYTKVPKSWIFNYGKNQSVKSIREKITLTKKVKVIEATRIINTKYDDNYFLCMRKGDNRNLLTNSKSKFVAKKIFEKYKIRWDVETCFKQLKENFSLEKLPVRSLTSITGFVFTSLLSLILLTRIKFKHESKLGSLFNKGFGLIIRWIIKANGFWLKNTKIILKNTFKFKYVFESYGLT